jgi:hypothetical protein
MGQINFIWGLIGEKLSFGAYFRLNWGDWNFKRPNLICTKLIDWNQGLNCKKIEVWGQLGAGLKKFVAKDQSAKGTTIEGLNWQKLGVKLKKLKVWWSIRG